MGSVSVDAAVNDIPVRVAVVGVVADCHLSDASVADHAGSGVAVVP